MKDQNTHFPLLSIVIPTHNRSHYAYFAIQSILSINDNRIEVVVSDTSGDDKLFTMLSGRDSSLILDPRLTFLRPIEKLDMTGNHNNALSAATGTYICLIGDDDTITPDALLATEWAFTNGVDIIAPFVVANYAWPDFLSLHFKSKHASRLYLPKEVTGIEWHDSKDALNKALANAAQGTDGLPKIYHGIVKRSLLEEIKTVSGAHFFGSSPDVSGAISLALCSKNFVTVRYPLTIPGASGGSNTGRSAMNQHKGKLSAESQTKSFENEGWSAGVPKFFSVETVWAHAALETIKKIASERVSNFNYSRLFAVCSILHPEYRAEIKQAMNEAIVITGASLFGLKRQIFTEILIYRLKRLSYLSRRLLHPTASGGRDYIAGLATIAETPVALQKFMKKKGWEWNQIISDFSKIKI